jgi:hypothetical protein
MGSYKFRVLLDNPNNEEIFRDIKISSENTFSEFYDIIIDSFYFEGDQLASFYASNSTWDKGREISLMDMDTSDGSESLLTMSDTILKDLVDSENQRFILVYDFLKMWCFLIELVGESSESTETPSIELSIGISPREDSREVDLGDSLTESSEDLGSEFDDIFNEFEDEDDFGGFENIDDFDI